MKTTIRRTLFLIFSIIAAAPIPAQTITNITVAQRTDGSGLTDVYYTLTGTAATYNISMEASFNNGTTFTPIASNFLSGHIGAVAPGSNRHIIWNGSGSNNNTYSAQAKVKLTIGPNTGGPCGQPFTIAHVAGPVAPVNKTTTYGTVTGIPGEPTKCWITSILGSDHQGTAVNDTTEASAGWYWQFNRKQGYKHTGTVRTPNTTWITPITENSDWQTANDPCILELGTLWRLPTKTEWTNVDAVDGWTNWNGPWNSGLKLHAAGYLNASNGMLSYRGSYGIYWSSTQASMDFGWFLYFRSGSSYMTNNVKVFGFSVRCLRD